MKNAIYILFSGGFDSTYLISKILKEKIIDKEIDIYLISVKSDFLGNKKIREEKSRKELLLYWKNKYNNYNIINQEISISIENLKISNPSSGLYQPLFWIPSLLSCIKFNYYNKISLLFSYILNDQALQFRKNIENIIYSYIDMMYIEKINLDYNINLIEDKKNFHIMFPLSLTNKEDIIKELIENHREEFLLCTTCEDPYYENDFCGVCTPCRNLLRSLNLLYYDDYINSDIKEFIREYKKRYEKIKKESE